ncbi:MAG: DinB family protein [Candidatus Eisenbacteria bacterium]|uniref:DinB family protein n=1 Tax=Eiseniibacteriota bacterium TaxID=2212470 RepID=A0A933W9J3_UNCEI|nr:DinB family protein [Candidatus Eisenbacteria bacterium]
MNEPRRIADQIRRSVHGPAWSGPSLLEALEGVSAKHAAARPIAGWKSIWELTLHAVVWQDAVRAHLAGRWPKIVLGGPRDWPPQPARPTAAAWAAALAKLKRSNRALEQAAAKFPAAKLDHPLKEGATSAYVQLHGAVQHNLWHGGQIVALKRALGLPAVKPKA